MCNWPTFVVNKKIWCADKEQAVLQMLRVVMISMTSCIAGLEAGSTIDAHKDKVMKLKMTS